MDAESAELELRWTLASDGSSSTNLQLLCSGFGSGAAWDDEFVRLQTALNVALAELRHYLEHHHGLDRVVATALSASEKSPEQLWSLLTSRAGLFYSGFRPHIAEGDRLRISLTTCDVVEGTVLSIHPEREILIAAHNLGDALFRLCIDRAAGQSIVQMQVSSWLLPEEEVKAFEQRLRRRLLRSMRGSRALLPVWV